MDKLKEVAKVKIKELIFDKGKTSQEVSQLIGRDYPDLETNFKNDMIEWYTHKKHEFIGGIEINTPGGIVRSALVERGFDPDKIKFDYNRNSQQYMYYPFEAAFHRCIDIPDYINVLKISKGPRKINALDNQNRNEIISSIIRRSLCSVGEFLKSQNEPYFFYEGKLKTIEDLSPLVHERFNCDLTTSDTRHLTNYALSKGKEIELHNYFYFDEINNLLYASDRKGKVYLLDGEKISLVENGYGGIFFNEKDCDPITYLPLNEREEIGEMIGVNQEIATSNPLWNLIACRSNYSFSTSLDPIEQRNQLLLHFYAFPFANYLKTKPIMAFIGEKGSGKTFTLQNLGYFFIKNEFEVKDIPSEKDMKIALGNSFYFPLDNVDSPKPWLQDLLASVATGMEIKRRKLWTDSQEVTIRPNIWMGITSRTPYFNRDDVVDRLLLFHCDRYKTNISHSDLFKIFKQDKIKNTLWSKYLDDINLIISQMKGNIEVTKVAHRLSDWVVFAKHCNKALGIVDDLEKLLVHMRDERITFSMSGSKGIYPALRKYFDGDVDYNWHTANKWLDILRRLDVPEFEIQEPKELGKLFCNLQSELNTLFGFKVKTGHINTYRILPDYSNKELEPLEPGEVYLVFYEEVELSNSKILPSGRIFGSAKMDEIIKFSESDARVLLRMSSLIEIYER